MTEGRARGERERRMSQIGRIRGDPEVVTITIGGNDARFTQVLTDCVVGSCLREYRRPSGDVLEARVPELERRLPPVYRAIQAAAPQARVVVTGYPRLFAQAATARPVGNCAAGGQISASEAKYLNDSTVKLNVAISNAAKEASVYFVDVTEAFDGHELSCRGASYMNRLRLQPQLFPASFHPNADGHARLGEWVARPLPRDG